MVVSLYAHGCGDCDSLLLSRGRRIADGYLLQRTATLGGESGDRAGDMRGVSVVVDTRGGEMARIILCINVNGDLWVLYYRTEPSRDKADESGRADLLRVTIYRIVLLDLAQGKMEIITRPRFLLDMVQLAILSTIVSARLLVAAVKLIGSVPSSVLGTLEPITAIVVGVLYFNEQLTYANYLGLLIVIVAVLVVICKMKK